MTDIEIGRKAIQMYHGHMKLMYPTTFKYSLDEFHSILTKLKGGKALAEGIGLGIRETGMSDSKVSEAMKRLAIRGEGKIPSSYMEFFNSLSNEAAKINFVDAASFVFVESGKQIIEGAEKIGNQVIFTGKILNFLLPAIILFFVFYWLNKGTGGSIGRASKSLLK